ncbi:MAG: hypothetical protein JNM27_08280 [Leptospirales bacterium]|nr:hypothetical protein [Leptospirales bacterium]
MNDCAICSIFQKEGWETENQPGDFSDHFPDSFQRLIEVHDAGYAVPNKIYQCPDCQRYFHYTRTTPGGSLNATQTYIVDRLAPISENEARERQRANPESTHHTSNDPRCPRCKSYNVAKLDSGAIGGEVFISYGCLDCGHEDFLDEYSLGTWFF